MDVKLAVWSVIRGLRLDELIAKKTGRGSLWRKAIPRSRAYDHERFEHAVDDDLKVIIDRGDYTQWRVFSGSLFINRRIFDFVRTDSGEFVMFDIGANIGAYTVLFSGELKVNSYRVHLFEPNPGVLPTLRENIARLAAARPWVDPTINPVALGAEQGVLSLNVDNEHTGLATLGVPESFGHTVPVNVIRLDDYVREQDIRRLDFVKIDVESYEPGVLNGARELLTRFRPTLYMEYSDDWFRNFSEAEVTELLVFMKSLGYAFFREDRQSRFCPLGMTVADLRQYRHLNILCVSR